MENSPYLNRSETDLKAKVEQFYTAEFMNHLQAYDLDYKDVPFSDKKILDVASGDRLLFPIGAAFTGMDNVYSLEPKEILESEEDESNLSPYELACNEELKTLKTNIPPEILVKVIKKHVRAKAEKMPFKDNSFDLILSKNAIPILYLPGQKDLAKQIMLEIIRVLKEGGEFRFASIDEAVADTENMSVKYLEKKEYQDKKNQAIYDLLIEISQADNIDYEIKETVRRKTFYDLEKDRYQKDSGIPIDTSSKVVIIKKLKK